MKHRNLTEGERAATEAWLRGLTDGQLQAARAHFACRREELQLADAEAEARAKARKESE